MLTTLNKLALRSKIRLSHLSSLIILCCVMPIAAHAIPFNSITDVYFFGDSCSDSGFYNRYYTNSYGKAPTFTTFGGYTWAQYVARVIKGSILPTDYNGNNPSSSPNYIDNMTNNMTPAGDLAAVEPDLNGFNYAAGGSTTNGDPQFPFYGPSLVTQVQYYLSTKTVDPQAVYFICSGSNDLIGTALSNPTQLNFLQTADSATTVIANQIALLRAKGAKRFVVLALYNLASTPLVIELGRIYPTFPAMVQTATFMFNSMLNQKLGGVIKSTGATVLYFDTYTLLQTIINNTNAGQPFNVAGTSFKFTNTTDKACGDFLSISCPPDSQYSTNVFADVADVTDLTHQAIALSVEQSILNWN